MAAILCFGLRDDSRTKMHIAGIKLTLERTLFAKIADELAFQSWAKTKDGQKNRNRPQSILKSLLESKTEDKIEVFDNAEEFNEAWRKIVNEQQ